VIAFYFRLVFAWMVLAALRLPADAQTFTWTGTPSGVQTTGAPGWSLIAPNMPGSPATLWSTGLPGASPSGGQAMDVVISSDFLLSDPNFGVHLVIGFNYTPVDSYGYYYANGSSAWSWGVEGNQASAFIVGTFSNGGITCSLQGAFEAIYQIPSWYPGGWYWGVTGGNGMTQNEISPCVAIPLFGRNDAGEYQVRLVLSSNYNGSLAANFFPPIGYPGFGNSLYSWQSWFIARAGSVPRNTAVALATIGAIPVGKHITVQVMNMSVN
jgi:hypothetical protein